MAQGVFLNKESKIVGLWVGAVFIALGLGVMTLMAFAPEGINVPMWVAQIGGSALVFAGLSFVARAKNAVILSRIFSFGVVAILSTLGLYFLLG